MTASQSRFELIVTSDCELTAADQKSAEATAEELRVKFERALKRAKGVSIDNLYVDVHPIKAAANG
ncbi:hypothetical protein SEA_MOLLYMUR_105 [Gordonia phage Mollymur]|uniref:Uncharacterized protein n=1 Tax=Gordonia phage Mollymur TaxID=2590895 RepID=A0A4Y6E9Y1_9CAUD|nr:hypothetical protein PQB84_gp021 [Gordonia phage Mollymur]QDF15465.1 hypothetical protein SEA_MOLLYMUR_105 [Gordonia phage Mollymur]